MHAFRARFHLASKLVPILAQAGKVIQGNCALKLFTHPPLPGGLAFAITIDPGPGPLADCYGKALGPWFGLAL